MDGSKSHDSAAASTVGQRITATLAGGKTLTGYILAADLKEHSNSLIIGKKALS